MVWEVTKVCQGESDRNTEFCGRECGRTTRQMGWEEGGSLL